MKIINYSGFSKDELLKLKMKNLSLKFKGSIMETRLKILYAELREKGLRFKPHTWISDEWFTPDDTAGFAIPFYLFHPRFMKLEKDQMFEAEGENKKECLQILRHETGHAISHAYKLYRLPSWKKIFGDFTDTYPLWYTPEINSKDYVTHLNAWYAQAHPLEDFAETFAVWLTPGSNWRKKYRSWPALKKLLYLDQIMSDIGKRKPIIPPGEEYGSLSDLKYTIGEHYKRKKKFYSVDWAQSFDVELEKIFTSSRTNSKLPAWVFLKDIRRSSRRNISDILDIPQYSIDQLFTELSRRCLNLNLHLKSSEEEAEKRILIIITAQLTNIIHTGYYRIPL